MFLKYGSQGEDVKKLQIRLGVGDDGIFGQGTLNEVKKFQSNNGLDSDGVVGDGTWAKLFPSPVVSITPPVQPAPAPTQYNLNLKNLKGYIPDTVIDQIPAVASKFNITTPLRLVHFLAQCAHESGKFTATYENLNYETSGLLRVFPYYFPTQAIAESYRMQKERIGSRVYGGRMGNGPESSGEGFKYRGRGFIQLTGKDNYRAFSNFIGEDCVANPDLVATKYPLASAAFYFNSRNLWIRCDKGYNRVNIEDVTMGVNGGLKGIEERVSYFNLYYNLLK